jgi:hypothetical protein
LINAWVAPTLLWVLCSFLWSALFLLNLKIWCLAEDKWYWHTDGNKPQETCEPVGCLVWGAKSLRSQGKGLLKLCLYKIRASHPYCGKQEGDTVVGSVNQYPKDLLVQN